MCIRHLQRISASLLLLCLFGYSAQGYYHHPVVLDENRHDDEFFTFVTVCQQLEPLYRVGTKLVWTPRGLISTPQDGISKFTMKPLSHQATGSLRRMKKLFNPTRVHRGMRRTSTTQMVTLFGVGHRYSMAIPPSISALSIY